MTSWATAVRTCWNDYLQPKLWKETLNMGAWPWLRAINSIGVCGPRFESAEQMNQINKSSQPSWNRFSWVCSVYMSRLFEWHETAIFNTDRECKNKVKRAFIMLGFNTQAIQQPYKIEELLSKIRIWMPLDEDFDKIVYQTITFNALTSHQEHR